MTQVTEENAYRKLTNLCATSEHCRSELTDKMKRWGMNRIEIDRVLNRLESEDFLNEERFCRAFVNDKLRFDKWGRIKMGQALQLKRISASLYRPLLANIDEKFYMEVLASLIKSKRRSIHADSELELKAKLIRFAQSRGFEMRCINQCLEVPEELNIEKFSDY